MIELPLIFLGGLLGSAHCVGMCGGFALLIGSGARGLSGNLVRQLVYSLGRIFTYAVCGGTLGYAGLRLAEDLPAAINVQAGLAILAGLLLVSQGLTSAGLIHRGMLKVIVAKVWRTSATAPQLGARHSSGLGCHAAGMLGAFLRAPALGHVFLAGMLTGLLPCGLVYGFLALAASTHGLFPGLATMAAFGLGTVPLMVLTGSGASIVSLATRQRLFQLAACCVIVTGLISLVRGIGFLDIDGGPAASSCPLCR